MEIADALMPTVQRVAALEAEIRCGATRCAHVSPPPSCQSWWADCQIGGELRVRKAGSTLAECVDDGTYAVEILKVARCCHMQLRRSMPHAQERVRKTPQLHGLHACVQNKLLHRHTAKHVHQRVAHACRILSADMCGRCAGRTAAEDAKRSISGACPDSI